MTVRLIEKDRDSTRISECSYEVYARIDESRQEAKMARTENHLSIVASVLARHKRKRKRTKFVEPSSEVRSQCVHYHVF